MVTSELEQEGWFVHGHVLVRECHKTCNGWYSGMAAPIVGVLIL